METIGSGDETKVTDSGTVAVLAEIRDRLGIDAGDKLRWRVGETGELSVEVIHQREGVFADFEPGDVGETKAVEIEREFGSE